ncbi:MAG: cysteine synthase A [Candidatus Melainabacteria bacterium]|nr:MAG: cysteine synthase A [Candidatus Melainabacteria bacterium]
MKVYENVLELIGKTPMVKYNDNILLKLEFLNPSHSVKDRASFYMLNEAKKQGLIDKDTVVIEPTSGNTGIGLAMCCAVMGLKIIIVMPESMSIERRKMIQGYGAELVLTPKEQGMQGAVDKAKELTKQYKNSFMPMQFANMANPLAHIETTSKEIFEDTDGKVDIFVAGIGTGGTATGVAKGLKDLKPSVKVYGVEPLESPLLTEGKAGPHKIQGIGANFVPEIYKNGKLDGVMTISGDEAIEKAKYLAKNKGILAGISSGANLAAALKLSEQNPNKLIVTVMCDFGERYLSTELFS